jgi:IS1 family transposase/transposase-like protein
MIAAVTCDHAHRTKHGKDRHGNQRWKCQNCNVTITCNNHNRPLGDMRIDFDTACRILGDLLEGMSIRACERRTGVAHRTICDLVLQVGEQCETWLIQNVKGVEAKYIEMDEIWGFVGMKQKTADKKNLSPEVAGDSWSWLAIDAESKVILGYAVGQRDEGTCLKFLNRVNCATVGHTQITSDGYKCYTSNVPYTFGNRADFAQLIKTYKSSQTETRYSPATIDRIEKKPVFGNPDESRISTSYSERFNLSVRMGVRRFTRLTNAHSKSHAHHNAMLALFIAFYNYCRPNLALKEKGKPAKTPAMAAGLADTVWSLQELLERVANS